MKYVRVKAGSVVFGPQNLPRAWKNISGFHLLPNERLKQHGWYKLLDNPLPPYDGKTERIVLDSYVIRPDDVERTWKIEPLPPEEIQQKADVAQQAEDIANIFPSRAQVDADVDALDGLAEVKVYIKKLARITCWLAKNTSL